MAARDRLPSLVMPALIGIGLAILVGQLVLDEPIAGPLGLLGLLPAAIAIVRVLGGGSVSAPERALAVTAATLLVAVFAGIVTALSPRGLDATSVAAVELGVTVAAGVAGRLRQRPGAVGRPRRLGRWAIRFGDIRGSAGPWALIAGGALLGLAGFGLATWSAATQDYGGFVQFWSLPASAGRAATVGIMNSSGRSLTCDVAIDRPGQGPFLTHAGLVADGQGWTADLPTAQPGETAPWQVYLECTSPDANPLYRLLKIDPPV
jgi:hypothetical protein